MKQNQQRTITLIKGVRGVKRCTLKHTSFKAGMKLVCQQIKGEYEKIILTEPSLDYKGILRTVSVPYPTCPTPSVNLRLDDSWEEGEYLIDEEESIGGEKIVIYKEDRICTHQ